MALSFEDKIKKTSDLSFADKVQSTAKSDKPKNQTNPFFEVPGVKQVAQFGVGVGSEIGKAGLSLGQAFLKGASAFANEETKRVYENASGKLEVAKKALYDEPFAEDLNSASGKIGKFVGAAAPYFSTTPAVNTLRGSLINNPVTKMATDAVNKVPFAGKAINYVADKALKAAPEALVTGATTYGLTGGDAEAAKNAAKWSGILSVGGQIAGDVQQWWKGDLKTNATKSLGVPGKQSAGSALNTSDKDVRALKVLKRYAPEVEVIDQNGVRSTFNPDKATFPETLQAWDQTRKNIYNQYSAAAGKAGNLTNTEVQSIASYLDDIKSKPTTKPYLTKLNELTDDLQRNFGEFNAEGNFTGYKPTSLDDMQTFLEHVNLQVAETPKGASAEISSALAKKIRDVMDDKITKATGIEYQALRDDYSALKSIESRLVNRFKQTIKAGSEIGQQIDGFNTADLMTGVLLQNPYQVLGSSQRIIYNMISKNFRNNTRLLREAFKGISDNALRSDMVVQATAAHMQEATDVLENLTRDQLDELGGMKDLLKNTKKNIVDGMLEGETSRYARVINNIDITKLNSLDELQAAIESALKNLDLPSVGSVGARVKGIITQ